MYIYYSRFLVEFLILIDCLIFGRISNFNLLFDVIIFGAQMVFLHKCAVYAIHICAVNLLIGL